MRKLFALSIIILSILSCEKEEENATEGVEGIIANIEKANLNSSTFPWETIGMANGNLKRWDIENQGLIPVKANGNALAIQAMDEIEEVLGKIIFDRTSINTIPDNEITRGLIVSEGTSIGPGGAVNESSCGMVSADIGTTNWPYEFYNENGIINTKLYIHLSSAGCTANLEIAIHEFGHAMGLGEHFTGFGNASVIDGNFWNVLYNIYSNPIGTVEADLIIEKIR